MANKEKLPEVIPPEIDNPPADLSVVIEKGLEAFGKVIAQNASAQIEVAKRLNS